MPAQQSHAVKAAPQGKTPAADATANRYGWIDNVMPSNLTLRDRDGTWKIVGGSTSGSPISLDQMPATNQGDSCSCLKVETNRQVTQIVKILG